MHLITINSFSKQDAGPTGYGKVKV